MLSKLALASALAIPLGLFALSAGAKADDWNPSGYNPKMTIPLYMSGTPRHAPAAAAAAPKRPMHRAVLSCEAASRIVRKDGFDHIVARNCGGKTYVFRAQRHGHPVTVDVNPRSGRAWTS